MLSVHVFNVFEVAFDKVQTLRKDVSGLCEEKLASNVLSSMSEQQIDVSNLLLGDALL